MAEAPCVGQIIEHYFLWVAEQAAGQVEGRKSRPCLIVAVEPRDNRPPRVTVLPITSQPPRGTSGAVAVPDEAKVRIGLDRSRPAWIAVHEANLFTWPGFDLLPQPDGGFVRGTITRALFERVREAALRAHTRSVERDEI